MLSEDELWGCPLLVYANKQDLPNALSVDEVAEKLMIERRIVHDWTADGYQAFVMGTITAGSAVEALHGNLQLLHHIWGWPNHSYCHWLTCFCLQVCATIAMDRA